VVANLVWSAGLKSRAPLLLEKPLAGQRTAPDTPNNNQASPAYPADHRTPYSLLATANMQQQQQQQQRRKEQEQALECKSECRAFSRWMMPMPWCAEDG